MIVPRRGRLVLGWLLDRVGPTVRRFVPADAQLSARLEATLRGARLPIAPERYLAAAVLLGLLAGVGFACLGLVGGIVVGPLGSQPPADVRSQLGIAGVLAGGFGVVGFCVGSGSVVGALYARVTRRRREIDLLLPDAVAFLYALAVGGRNQLELIETVAQAEEAYGAVAVEFQTIQTEMAYFDTDYRTAIRNQALRTPSDSLAQFLTDLLSVLSSGGDLEAFLEEQTTAHRRTAQQRQERTLDTLELLGELYLTVSLFPLLLIIVLVVMQLVGQGSLLPLYLTVYVLIPVLGLAFLVLVSMVTHDEPTEGVLTRVGAAAGDAFTAQTPVGAALTRHHHRQRLLTALKRPHTVFRAHPLATLAVTVPAAVVIIAGAAWTGVAPTAWTSPAANGIVEQPVWGTVVYVYFPAYLVGLPLCLCYESAVRTRRAITATLSDTLRKLSSANDTGLTFLEAIRTVAATGTGKLAAELQILHQKVTYGMRLRDALIEFNNTYESPRLARTITLIATAHETSGKLTRVLHTAAVASEHQDEIDRQRRDRTRMQVVIISLTFFTLLAVLALLQSQFVGVVDTLADADAAHGLGVGSIDPALLSLVFFHGVTVHAIVSGLVAGSMRHGEVLAGVKYVLGFLTVSLAVWLLL